MTLPSTGTLSFSQVNVEIIRPSANTLGLNDSVVRTLAVKTTPGSTIGTADLRGKTYAFRRNITANVANLNLRQYCVDNGWDQNLAVEITIDAGVYVYGTIAGDSTPALTIDGSWPNGVTLINKGYIVGRGGAGGAGAIGTSFTVGSATNGAGTAGGKGGRALLVTVACTINNTGGLIGGGGGGGGGSGGLLLHIGSTRYVAVGGSGGGGGRSGPVEATAGTAGTRTFYVGTAPFYSDGTFAAFAGTTAGGGNTTSSRNVLYQSGTSAGNWASATMSVKGGVGGPYGAPGYDTVAAPGTLPPSMSVQYINYGAFGAAGTAVTGNSFITWTALGTRSGTIIA